MAEFEEIAEDKQYPHIPFPTLLDDNPMGASMYVQDILASDQVGRRPVASPQIKPGNQGEAVLETTRNWRIEESVVWPVWAFKTGDWISFSAALATLLVAPMVLPKIGVGEAVVSGYVVGGVTRFALSGNEPPHHLKK